MEKVSVFEIMFWWFIVFVFPIFAVLAWIFYDAWKNDKRLEEKL